MKKDLYLIKIAVVVLGMFLTTNAKAFTAVISGDWSNAATWGGVAPGASVSNQDVTIPVGITVNLDQNVTFSGVINSFVVDGTLYSTSNNWVMMSSGTLAGNGTVGIHTLTFGMLATASFSGNLNVHRLVNQSLALGITALANVSDTLFLESGTLNVNANGNLTMAGNSTIKVDDGAISVSGGILNLTNSYSVMYVGSSKTTGIELNSTTIDNLYLMMNNNNQTVSLNGNTTVNGNLMMNSGILGLNGHRLTLKSHILWMSGSAFSSTAASELSVEGNSGQGDTLTFTTGSSIGDLTINRSGGGSIALGSNLSISGSIHLIAGGLTIENGAVLSMVAASTIYIQDGSLMPNMGTFDGSAAYNVTYVGSSNTNAGVELSGSGLNDVTINYTYPINQLNLTDSVSVGGNLNMIMGGIRLYGNVLTLNGTLTHSSSCKFMGNSNSELNLNLTSAAGDTLFFEPGINGLAKLRVNNNSGTIVIGSDLLIYDELAFINGKVALADDLTIIPTATISGYDDAKYIVTSENTGSLVMNVFAGASYVTFPVGTADNYSPAYIQQNAAGSTGDFSVRAMNTVLSNGTSGFISSSIAKVVDRTWFINSSAANVNMNMKLGWTSAAEVNGFDRTNAYISNYASGWDVMSPSGAVTGADNTYELARSGITTLNPAFAVVEDGEAIGVKEVVHSGSGIDLYPNPAGTVLNVSVNNANGHFRYELSDLSGRVVSSKESGNAQVFDVKGLDAGYYFVRITNLDENTTSIKKFIKQ